MKIKFSSHVKEYVAPPGPALNYIPEEYKKIPKFIDNNLNKKTVKGCIPFLDALTCGYIIPFPFDIYFSYSAEEQAVNFFVPEILPEELREYGVSAHPDFNMPTDARYDKRTVDVIFKFLNPWNIQTPPGYSCLFTTPFNRNTPFKIIDGVVDTDEFTLPINFPFYWTNPSNQNFLLEKGSPMVLVIPFKREEWKSEIVYQESSVNSEIRKKTFTTFINTYKNKFWRKKSYK